jgi:type 1 glutamine amidotransferase
MTQTSDPLADPKMAWLKGAVKQLEESTGRKNDYPISWIKPYGRGRVFYCSLGVQKAPYSSPLFLQYLLAGIQFALGDLPADMTPSEK